MAGLIISPRARIFQGHDWVYGTEVRKVFGNPQPGDVVALKDFKDRFLGSAMFNPHSQIVARRFSRRKQELDGDFFSRRISQAVELRRQWLPEETLRSLGLHLIPSCGACLSNMAVTPNGQVVPCQSWLGGTTLGNLLTDDWSAIWDGETCRAIRAKSAKLEHICQLGEGNREGC